MMESLNDRIRREIAEQGPMSVARYMALCLTDPEQGYYRRRGPLGAAGDFVTAPEISQIFGEIVGLWCAAVWQSMGSPPRVRFVELGPGRGTMMADALRALRLVPELIGALDLTLIEVSETLRAIQQSQLAGAHPRIAWAYELGDLPPGPTILLANEFVDALPIRQLVRTAQGWLERAVGIDPAGEMTFTTLAGEADGTGPIALSVANAPIGSIFEQRLGLDQLLQPLGAHAREYPFAALFIDYGHLACAPGDTLQAIRGHSYAPVLAAQGKQDLTAQVDFEALCAAAHAAGLAVDGPIPQAEFLVHLGLIERAQRLMLGQPARTCGLIESGATRLIDPAGMGSRFKAVGFRSPGLPVLPAFLPAF